MNQILEKREIVLWKFQKSKSILDSVEIGIGVLISSLFVFISMPSIIWSFLTILIAIFWFSIIIFVVIMEFRNYLTEKREDELRFFSNKRIGIAIINRDPNTGLNFTVDQIKIEDIVKIKIVYTLKSHDRPTFSFFTKSGEIFQFEEVRGGYKSLRKKLIENLNAQTIEKVSNDTEVIIMKEN